MAKLTVDTKFYTMRQNNSGGDFLVDHKAGIGLIVIVEALDVDDAERRANDIVSDHSQFCPCCVDRWNTEFFDDEASDEPTIYGKPLELHEPSFTCVDSEDCYTHKINGDIDHKRWTR